MKDLSETNSLHTEEDSEQIEKIYIPELIRRTRSLKSRRYKHAKSTNKSIHVESEDYLNAQLLGTKSD